MVGCPCCLRLISHLDWAVLADVVRRKGATVGGLDCWGWFDGPARILTKDAYIALMPKVGGDPWDSNPSCCSVQATNGSRCNCPVDPEVLA